jgi:hypothetical protein
MFEKFQILYSCWYWEAIAIFLLLSQSQQSNPAGNASRSRSMTMQPIEPGMLASL